MDCTAWIVSSFTADRVVLITCSDGLSDIETTHPHLTPSKEEEDALFTSGVLSRPSPDIEDAPHLLHHLLAQHPAHSIGFLTLGPLTTLAASIALDRSAFFSRFRLVVSMAGALDVPGNTTAVAEFNVRADAYAMHEVLRSGLGHGTSTPRWLLVPVDTTTRHTLSFADYTSRIDPNFPEEKAVDTSPLVQFTTAILKRTQKVMSALGGDGVELHDPLAAWCMAAYLTSEGEEPTAWKVGRRLFDCERTGELTRGMLVVGAFAPLRVSASLSLI